MPAPEAATNLGACRAGYRASGAGTRYQAGLPAGPGPTISKMTVTLLTSQSAPTDTDADALVIGVFQGPNGPVPTLGIDQIDVVAALTGVGATGKPEEITKSPTADRLGTPVVAAAGLGAISGPDDPERQGYLERLRRAAGAATRDLSSGRTRRIAIALPADEPDEAGAGALGAPLRRD